MTRFQPPLYQKERPSGLSHHDEPALDEDDFHRFVTGAWPLMKAGRDVMWVMAGRTKANQAIIEKILRKVGFKWIDLTLSLIHI